MNNPSIEVCFSPALAEFIQTGSNSIVVVADILRATTSIVSAITNGAKSVIPVSSIEKAMEFKKYGFPVAAERDGVILSFADFGNSALAFMNKEVEGQKLIFTTTNGTVAIETGKNYGEVVIGAFSNLSAVASWVSINDKNVIILCSGWKGSFCLEDTIFAGALIEKLLMLKHYKIHCDSASASVDLWNTAKPNLRDYAEKAVHRERLRKLGVDDVLDFSFTPDTTTVVPVLKDGELIDASKF